MTRSFLHLTPVHLKPIFNHFRLYAPNGLTKQLIATAINPDPTESAHFELNMHPDNVPQHFATKRQYLVILVPEANPITHEYDWAVVSDVVGIDLFILARDVVEFKLKYQTFVLVEVGAMGYRFPFNRPRDTYQGRDCEYLNIS